MKATLRRALAMCVLAGSLALALALAIGVGSAYAQSSVVGPGESIQKAIYAAHPGDTVVVKGVHREDVVIRKDGIKLRGEDGAVIEAPPKTKADSPCSRAFGPEGICVLGDVNLDNGELTGPRVSDVSISGLTVRGFKEGQIDTLGTRNATVTKVRTVGNNGIGTAFSVGTKFLSNVVRGAGDDGTPFDDGIGLSESRDVTIAKNDVEGNPDGAVQIERGINVTIASNDLTDNSAGVLVFDSTGTKVLSNDVSHSGLLGIFMAGPNRDNNAKVVGNHILGGPWGIFVTDAHDGSIVGNTVNDNCAGIWFEAFGPVRGFKVTGNTVAENTRSCQGQKFGRKFSGIGIALLGASGMQVSANHLWGNVPSGPTPISGGVVVATDPYFGVTAKPTNNTVSANVFRRNKPDILWDKSGSGNSFVANLCDTSVPSSLCKS